jgi:hypothetical protein
MNVSGHECGDLTSLLGQACSKPGNGTAQPPGNPEPTDVITFPHSTTEIFNPHFRNNPTQLSTTEATTATASTIITSLNF